jgi:murein DD-endopeptidase MepM/ murein hydrolase activator NlpD
MPWLPSRHGTRHAPLADPARAGRRPRRRRLALLGGPLLVVAGAVVTAPALTPAALPTPSPDAFAGPIDIVPATPPPSDVPGATPTPAPTPAPTPLPTGPLSEPPEKLTGYVWPLRGARFTSGFGPRDDGGIIINNERYHDGIDLASWCGDKVRAAHSGTVLYVGRKFDEHVGYSGPMDAFYARMEQIGGLVRWLPIVVVIDDGNGYRSVYAHLSKATVEAGDAVAAGDVIGLEGATGRATGCHLHYSLIRMDGAWLSVEPSFVRKLRYPPFVRERVDPLLVLPGSHVDAPLRIQRRNRLPDNRLPYVLELR